MKPLQLPRASSFSTSDSPGSYSPRPAERPVDTSSNAARVTNAKQQRPSQRRSPSQPMADQHYDPTPNRGGISHRQPSTTTTLTVRECFVAGEAQSSRRRLDGASYRSNPARGIRTVAVNRSGDTVLTGDRVGRLFLYEMGPTADKEEEGMLHYKLGKQIYTSVIDPLNNVEVTPAVTKAAFLPRLCAAQHILTTNEKIPKLYKYIEVSGTPATHLRAVEQLDVKAVGALTSPQMRTVALKQMHHYAMDHENVIHSLSVTQDGAQFITADPQSVRLWCVEHPQTSIEVLQFRGAKDGGMDEHITNGSVFPHAPHLYFACTTSGHIRVVDMRESLSWSSQRAALNLSNPPRSEEGQFKDLCATVTSCALSPCGRYVAGRDAMTAMIWDIRSGSHNTETTTTPFVSQWDLHPHLRPQLDTLYQSELLFERFDIQFIESRASGTAIVTGSFDNRLCVIQNPQSTSVSDKSLQSVSYFAVPQSGSTSLKRDGVAAAASRPEQGSPEGMENGSRITSIGTGASFNGDLQHLFLSNGETLVHCQL